MESSLQLNPECTEEYFDHLMSDLMTSKESQSDDNELSELEYTEDKTTLSTDNEYNHIEQKPALSISVEKNSDCSSSFSRSLCNTPVPPKLSNEISNSKDSHVGNEKSEIFENKIIEISEPILNSSASLLGCLKRSIYDYKNSRSKRRIVGKRFSQGDNQINFKTVNSHPDISSVKKYKKRVNSQLTFKRSEYVGVSFDIVTKREALWIENGSVSDIPVTLDKQSLNWCRSIVEHPNTRLSNLLSNQSVNTLEGSQSNDVQCDISHEAHGLHTTQYDTQYWKTTLEELENIYLSSHAFVPCTAIKPPAVYQCEICREQFVFQTAYNKHLAREVTEMIFNCFVCKSSLKFPNICRLKKHIISHGSKISKYSAVIIKKIIPGDCSSSNDSNEGKSQCTECNGFYESLEVHLSEVKKPLDFDAQCRVCLYVSPSFCGIRIHTRLHLGMPPYCCPECGSRFPTQNAALAHVKDICCHFEKSHSYLCSYCGVLFEHIKMYKEHLISRHNTLLYQCINCNYSCSTLKEITYHANLEHPGSTKLNPLFHVCQFCPNQLIPRGKYSAHVSEHVKDPAAVRYVYRCINCKLTTSNKTQFLDHKSRSECYSVCQGSINPKPCTLLRKNPSHLPSSKSDFKEKACGVLTDSVVDSNIMSGENSAGTNKNITGAIYKCLLCGIMIDHVWSEVIKHYSGYHKIQDVKYLPKYIVETTFEKEVMLERDSAMNKRKTVQEKPDKMNEPKKISVIKTEKCDFQCKDCSFTTANIDVYRKHIVSHRTDPDLYQCLECAACFVVRPSLERHLIGFHGIDDVDDYINTHDVCHNLKNKKGTLLDHQCSVCMEVFESPSSLCKHFRSHGMAFLNQIKQV